jgi:hypothetical protein
MSIQNWFCGLGLVLLPVIVAGGDIQPEKVRNDKVLVLEHSLEPGESISWPGDRAGVAIYLDDGSIEVTPAQGPSRAETVQRGQAEFQPLQEKTMKNTGSSALRIVRTEYLGKGSSGTWGTAGLAPNYKLLFENQYGRVYDIRMAAGKSEPLHSHHDRVVVCLSGAELEHEMPDGRRETSTLVTGEIAWRRSATHIGHNLGKTDLWVIAIEPK